MTVRKTFTQSRRNLAAKLTKKVAEDVGVREERRGVVCFLVHPAEDNSVIPLGELDSEQLVQSHQGRVVPREEPSHWDIHPRLSVQNINRSCVHSDHLNHDQQYLIRMIIIVIMKALMKIIIIINNHNQ